MILKCIHQKSNPKLIHYKIVSFNIIGKIINEYTLIGSKISISLNLFHNIFAAIFSFRK